MSIELVMPSNHLTLCHPLLLLLSIFPSIRVFSNESALCIMWPKYWTLSISINPSNKYSGLISFRIDWFDLVCVCLVAQSCLTLCESMEGSTPCSSVKGIVYFIDLFQFSRLVVSDSLQPHALQHARPPCLSLTPGVSPNSCPSSR